VLGFHFPYRFFFVVELQCDNKLASSLNVINKLASSLNVINKLASSLKVIKKLTSDSRKMSKAYQILPNLARKQALKIETSPSPGMIKNRAYNGKKGKIRQCFFCFVFANFPQKLATLSDATFEHLALNLDFC